MRENVPISETLGMVGDFQLALHRHDPEQTIWFQVVANDGRVWNLRGRVHGAGDLCVVKLDHPDLHTLPGFGEAAPDSAGADNFIKRFLGGIDYMADEIERDLAGKGTLFQAGAMWAALRLSRIATEAAVENLRDDN